MYRVILTILFFTYTLCASQLESKISNMLVIGFDGVDINKTHAIYKHLQNYPLGGVILFDKNIQNQKQLQNLTSKLKSISKNRLLITVDEEGGRVSRLGKIPGFTKSKAAFDIALSSKENAQKEYENMAKMLQTSGVNCNLAPSVDLAINPQNSVIVKNRRSFSKDPQVVYEYATIFIGEMQKNGILSVLKHFPGHGSSMGDSHEGFVDVSDSWSKKELIPFKELIKNPSTKMIMTAHIYNKNIDKLYPATLSKATNQKLLRKELGFNGVLISDDLQMGAISKHFTLEQTLKLAINSSVDLLLFSKQIDIKEVVSKVMRLVKNGEIDPKMIDEANKRIDKLKRELL